MIDSSLSSVLIEGQQLAVEWNPEWFKNWSGNVTVIDSWKVTIKVLESGCWESHLLRHSREQHLRIPILYQNQSRMATGNKSLGTETADLAKECQKLNYSYTEEVLWC